MDILKFIYEKDIRFIHWKLGTNEKNSGLIFTSNGEGIVCVSQKANYIQIKPDYTVKKMYDYFRIVKVKK